MSAKPTGGDITGLYIPVENNKTGPRETGPNQKKKTF